MTNEFHLTLSEFNMVKHDFYHLLWNKGLLSRDDLKYYAEQYYHVEENFLHCLKEVSNLYEIQHAFKEILSDNIADESGNKGRKSHLQLWLQFCEFLGSNALLTSNVQLNDHTKLLLSDSFKIIRRSFPSAVGFFYAYEHQIPGIAKSKIEGLLEHYGVDKKASALDFFYEHKKMDVWHTKQWESIVDTFGTSEFAEFHSSTIETMKLLLFFLDGIVVSRNLHSKCVA